MNKKDLIWIPINFALIAGLITGAINEFTHAFPSADWAANGQSFIDRWLNKQTWFLTGFLPGALVGLVSGILWNKVRRKTK